MHAFKVILNILVTLTYLFVLSKLSEITAIHLYAYLPYKICHLMKDVIFKVNDGCYI